MLENLLLVDNFFKFARIVSRIERKDMSELNIKVGDLVELNNKDLVNHGVRMFVASMKKDGEVYVANLGLKFNQIDEKTGKNEIKEYGLKVPCVWLKKVE